MPNNNSNGNISQQQLDAMLKMASSRLGVSQDQLKSILSDKKSTEELLSRIGGTQRLQSALNNPESLERMIRENPKASKLLNDLLGDKKNG